VYLELILSILRQDKIGPAFIAKNYAFLKDRKELNFSNEDILWELFKINQKEHLMEKIEESLKASNSIKSKLEEQDIFATTIFDKSFPEVVLDAGMQWPILYYKGSRPGTKCIGIIGSRESNTIGDKIASRIGEYFSKKGFSIVNGLAKGIDEASLAGVNSLKSVGVLPSGLGQASLAKIGKNYQYMIDLVLSNGGTIVSSFLPHEAIDQYKTVNSCKLQAAFSSSLVLVQSRLKGGSRFTIESFCKLDRPLGIVQDPSSGEVIEHFEANRKIIVEGKRGLSEYTKVKEDKINCEIVPIQSRDDYLIIENKMSGSSQQMKLF
jgi:DNA processing protein